MILRLILRDRAVRRLLPWLLPSVLIGLMLASNQQDAVRHGLTVGEHGFQGFRYVAYLPWGIIGLHLLCSGIVVRCERLDATLAIPYRGLWLSRALALLQARGVNLLVLDEPTNHLDLPAIEQLEQALDTFDGTILLVTHDRRMLETVRLTRRWHLENGQVSEITRD